MATLEALIAAAFTNGELTHLSVVATADGKFKATYTPARAQGYYTVEDAFPIVAMSRALQREGSTATVKRMDELPQEPKDHPFSQNHDEFARFKL